MLQDSKILITGLSGRLGKVFQKIFPHAIYPSRKEMDITNSDAIEEFLLIHQPEIIIHLAAIASIPGCENNKELAWTTNVVATRNLVEISKKL